MTEAIRARVRTADRGPPVVGPPEGEVAIHTTEQLSANMKKMPNGNLVCYNVPVARVGWMMYGPGETPVPVGEQGVAYVERREEDLFNPITMGSIMGAAVTDEHPMDDVTPNNWGILARGFATTNIRRGTGDDADLVLADLIVTRKDLIDSVLAGKREVSMGYDATYVVGGPGLGRQTKIICNHIALVKKGRCGPRCAIGDEAFQPPTEEEQAMPTPRVKLQTGAPARTVLLSAARQRAADAQAELEELEAGTTDSGDGLPGDTHIHIHSGPGGRTGDAADPKDSPLEERLTALESNVARVLDGLEDLVKAKGKKDDDEETDEEKKARLAKEAKDKTKDSDTVDDEGAIPANTTDSAALATGYNEVLAQAEILVPGFRVPTFDAAKPRKATVEVMCATRRRALDAAYATKEGAALIEGVAATKTLDLATMDCKGIATLFKAAAGAKALMNNVTATRDSASIKKLDTGVDNRVGGAKSIAEINAANAKFWEGKAA